MTCKLLDIIGQPSHLIPWLEYSGDMDLALTGLRIWRKACHAAIVSCDPRHVDHMQELIRRTKYIRIIPGLKTSPILTPSGFDSIEGWKAISAHVTALAKHTKSPTVLFEHESAIKPYIEGTKYLAPALPEALQQLPKLHYLWYPSAAMSGPILSRYLMLAQLAFAFIPNITFIDHTSFYSPTEMGKPGTIACVNALKSIVGNHILPLIYCCGDRWWPYDQVTYAAKLSNSTAAIVYPGQSRWIEAAKAISK